MPDSGAATAKGRAAKARRTARPAPPSTPAPTLTVARVVVDLPLPHLDRTFDYLVTEAQHEQAVDGCRVRVRFAGQLVDGYLLKRVASSDHPGRLTPLARVVSNEPVLTPQIAALARAVADRYAGAMVDVLRLAIPRRQAAVEAEPPRVSGAGDPKPLAIDNTQWTRYTGGSQLLERLAAGKSPRAVWSALPGPDWPTALAEAVAAAAVGGRGSLVVVPDQRDIERVSAAFVEVLGEGQHTVLTADLGPRERYRRWLAIRRGQIPIVLGTRAAAFAPVHDLGLVALWDDGDDLHAEPRAPYPHVREVLALRAHQSDLALLVAGYARTAEGESLVSSGFARSVVAPRTSIRAAAPRIRATDDAAVTSDPEVRRARIPHVAWRTARDALQSGPVLVQVPRRGYLPATACTRCHSLARCVACSGPLLLPAPAQPPVCRWCGHIDADWHCAECGSRTMRAVAVGARRTAEELGRAFPGTQVVTSGGGTVLAEVPDRPALVVSTPGAEPVAERGYSAALLLDSWALLGRADLRAGEEALRRWLTAAALVRSASHGGVVVVVGDAALRPIQALVRWDPAGFATRELDDRAQAGLPPALRVAEITGAAAGVDDLLARVALPDSAELLGPAALAGDKVRVLIKVPRAAGTTLSLALRQAAGERSAHKAAESVTIRIDPQALM